jgi:hypothetical protein
LDGDADLRATRGDGLAKADQRLGRDGPGGDGVGSVFRKLYLLCNQSRKLLKALCWDRNGFCLWQKRLERDHFPWPKSEERAKEISQTQLRMVLEGIDFWNAHQKLAYTTVL